MQLSLFVAGNSTESTLYIEGNGAMDRSFRFICQSIITIGLRFRKKSLAVIKCALYGTAAMFPVLVGKQQWQVVGMGRRIFGL